MSDWIWALLLGFVPDLLPGGTHNYFGKPVEKNTISDANRPAERADINRANRLLYAAGTMMLGFILLAAIFL